MATFVAPPPNADEKAAIDLGISTADELSRSTISSSGPSARHTELLAICQAAAEAVTKYNKRIADAQAEFSTHPGSSSSSVATTINASETPKQRAEAAKKKLNDRIEIKRERERKEKEEEDEIEALRKALDIAEREATKSKAKKKKKKKSSSSDEDSAESSEADDDLVAHGGTFTTRRSSSRVERASPFWKEYSVLFNKQNDKATYNITCTPIYLTGTTASDWQLWSHTITSSLTSHGFNTLLLIRPVIGISHRISTSSPSYDFESPLATCSSDDMNIIRDHLERWLKVREMSIVLYGFICLCCSRSSTLTGRLARIPADNAYEAFKVIRDLYLNNNADSIHEKVREFNEIRQDDETAAMFGERILKAVDILQKMGHQLPLVTQRERLFTGLRQGYLPEINRYKGSVLEKEDMEDTIKRLTGYEFSLKDESRRGSSASSSTSPPPHHANAAFVRGETGRKNDKPRDLICVKCGTEHFSSRSNPCKKTWQICTHCNNSGHPEKLCYNKNPHLRDEANKRRAERGLEPLPMPTMKPAAVRKEGGSVAIVIEHEETTKIELVAEETTEFNWMSKVTTSIPIDEAEVNCITNEQDEEQASGYVDSGATMTIIMGKYRHWALYTTNQSSTITGITGDESAGGTCGGIAIQREDGIVIQLDNVVFDDNVAYNLFSVSSIEDQYRGGSITKDRVSTITDNDGNVIMRGRRAEGERSLYKVDFAFSRMNRRDIKLPIITKKNIVATIYSGVVTTKPMRLESSVIRKVDENHGDGYYPGGVKTNPMSSTTRQAGEQSINQVERLTSKFIQIYIDARTAAGDKPTDEQHDHLCQLFADIQGQKNRLTLMSNSRYVSRMVTYQQSSTAVPSAVSNNASLDRVGTYDNEDKQLPTSSQCVANVNGTQNGSRQCSQISRHGELCVDHTGSITNLRLFRIQGGTYVVATTIARPASMVASDGSKIFEVVGYITGQFWTKPADSTAENNIIVSSRDGRIINSTLGLFQYSAGVHNGQRYYIYSGDDSNNIIKFVSHSEDPNCTFERNIDQYGRPHITVATKKNIPAGAILTVNLSMKFILEEESRNINAIGPNNCARQNYCMEGSDDDNEEEPIAPAIFARSAMSVVKKNEQPAPSRRQYTGPAAAAAASTTNTNQHDMTMTATSRTTTTSKTVTTRQQSHKRLKMDDDSDGEEGQVRSSNDRRTSRSTNNDESMRPTRNTTPNASRASMNREAQFNDREELRRIQIEHYHETAEEHLNGNGKSNVTSINGSVQVYGLQCVAIGDRRGWNQQILMMVMDGNEERCKNGATEGVFCPYHLEKEEGLKVKTSNTTGAGRGLFAAKHFRAGDLITTYTGIHGNNNIRGPYIWNIAPAGQPPRTIDATHTNTSMGRWINDGCYNIHNNVFMKLNHENGHLEVRAKRYIHEGEEFLVDYGYDFWTARIKDRSSAAGSNMRGASNGAGKHSNGSGDWATTAGDIFYYGETYTPKMQCHAPKGHTFVDVIRGQEQLGAVLCGSDARFKNTPTMSKPPVQKNKPIVIDDEEEQPADRSTRGRPAPIAQLQPIITIKPLAAIPPATISTPPISTPVAMGLFLNRDVVIEHTNIVAKPAVLARPTMIDDEVMTADDWKLICEANAAGYDRDEDRAALKAYKQVDSADTKMANDDDEQLDYNDYTEEQLTEELKPKEKKK